MVSALASENFAGYPHVSDDLLLPFNMVGTAPIGASFSCAYNAPNPVQNDTKTALYSRFAISAAPPALGIGDEYYLHPDPEQSDNRTQPIQPISYSPGICECRVHTCHVVE